MGAMTLDWLNLGLRWLHLIAGIAWIGSSFYFVALDASLRKRMDLPQGVQGEEWQVHGGGFYHMMKYTVAPAHMPEHLTWFKWEAYTTWLSGFALLVVMYYFGADLYMVDHEGWTLPGWAASLIGILTLAVGWVGYDALCKSKLGEDQRLLVLGGLVLLPIICVLLDTVLAARGAFFHIGALTGTIMVANVAMVIIPNQKKVVADLKAGRTPDPKLGAQAKQRSLHNNYLTLPVLFIMISGHYPQLYASPLNWLIVGLILVVGAVIRHWFNVHHAGKPAPHWAWGVAAAGALAIVLIASRPATADAAPGAEAEALPPDELRAEAEATVQGYCSMCHAREPLWEGIPHAPKGVYLETPEDIERHAFEVYTHAYLTHAMPPGNVTEIGDDERRLLGRWYEALRGGALKNEGRG
ncbi:MAG: urate hydroxylase PuuD [Geminicoccaceae bacterium]|nr:urate hydroxylase PuuD [Geminicoccaceae bacterium]